MPDAIVAADRSLTTCILTPDDVEGLRQDLSDYAAQFAPAFARKDQAVWAHRYLVGLLSQLPRKSIEPIALAHGFPIRAMQAFIADSPWPTQPLLEHHQHLVAQTLADDDAVLLIDESGIPKQGQHSAGVARQYCGALGKICSCQVGVFLGYACCTGYTLLDGQLFVPEPWFSEQMAELRQEVGIPAELRFQTKPEIAVDLLQTCVVSGRLPARWVAADALYGNAPAFRDAVDKLGLWYFTEVSCDQLIWRRSPALIVPAWSGKGRKPSKLSLKTPSNAPYRVDELLRRLPKSAWTRATIKEGSKGPMVCEFAFVRVNEARQGLPGRRQWVIIRRNLDEPTVVKYYLTNAPETMATTRLARMSGVRWPIELIFEVSKDELGLDHYETRGWLGWHHHMVLVMLAHHFLVWVRRRWGEKAPEVTLAQVRLLLTSVLPRLVWDAKQALLVVLYYQRRNRSAYLAHRKRRLARLAEFGYLAH